MTAVTEQAAIVTAREAVDRLAAAETELADLLVHLGETVPDPKQARKLATSVAGARLSLELAARAVPAAAKLEQRATRQDLLDQADALNEAIEAARSELDQHSARAAELRQALEEFTQTRWIEASSARDSAPVHSLVIGGQTTAVQPSVRRVLEGRIRGLVAQQEQLRRSAENVAIPAVVSPEWAEASGRLAETGEPLGRLSVANVAVVRGRQRLSEINAASAQIEAETRDARSLGGELDQLAALAAERQIVSRQIADAEDQIRTLIAGAR